MFNPVKKCFNVIIIKWSRPIIMWWSKKNELNIQSSSSLSSILAKFSNQCSDKKTERFFLNDYYISIIIQMWQTSTNTHIDKTLSVCFIYILCFVTLPKYLVFCFGERNKIHFDYSTTPPSWLYRFCWRPRPNSFSL